MAAADSYTTGLGLALIFYYDPKLEAAGYAGDKSKKYTVEEFQNSERRHKILAERLETSIKACNFDVECNPAKDIVASVEATLKRGDLGKYKRFFFAYQGHGASNVQDGMECGLLLQRNHQMVRTRWLLQAVADCPAFSFNDVPKVYLLDCCRCKTSDPGLPAGFSPHPSKTDAAGNEVRAFQSASNFTLFAAAPGHFGYADLDGKASVSSCFADALDAFACVPGYDLGALWSLTCREAKKWYSIPSAQLVHAEPLVGNEMQPLKRLYFRRPRHPLPPPCIQPWPTSQFLPALPKGVLARSVLTLLGEGGSGEVYAGQWSEQAAAELAVDVAVKLIAYTPPKHGDAKHKKVVFETSKQAFLREASIQAGIHTQGIVPLLAICMDTAADGTSATEFALVMPRLTPLEDKLKAAPFEQRLRWARLIASALSYCHTQPHADGSVVVHGDLKTTNVLLDSKDMPAIGDFGVSASYASAGLLRAATSLPSTPSPRPTLPTHVQSSVLRRDGGTITPSLKGARGSPVYMDPLLWGTEAAVGTASDVYSLAVTVWDLLTQQEVLPFGEKVDPRDADAVKAAVLAGRRPPLELCPPETPLALLQVMWEAMEGVEQAMRPDAAEFVHAAAESWPAVITLEDVDSYPAPARRPAPRDGVRALAPEVMHRLYSNTSFLDTAPPELAVGWYGGMPSAFARWDWHTTQQRGLRKSGPLEGEYWGVLMRPEAEVTNKAFGAEAAAAAPFAGGGGASACAEAPLTPGSTQASSSSVSKLRWQVSVQKAGLYKVRLEIQAEPEFEGARVSVRVSEELWGEECKVWGKRPLMAVLGVGKIVEGPGMRMQSVELEHAGPLFLSAGIGYLEVEVCELLGKGGLRLRKVEVERCSEDHGFSGDFGPVIEGSLAVWRSAHPEALVANVSGRRDLCDADFQYLRGIKALDMSSCHNISSAAFIYLRGIIALDMSNCSQSAISDAAFVHLTGIKVLNMSTQRTITDAAFVHLTGIHTLYMGGCTAITDAAFVHLTGIHTLGMEGCTAITDAALVHLTGIHTLYMRGCTAITDAAFVHLTGIHTLVMSYCTAITDAALFHLRGIHSLYMRGCIQITDAAFLYLRGIRVLEMSFIEKGTITDAAAGHLHGIHKLCFLNLA